MEKTITCIGCPMGCQVTVVMDGTEIVDIQNFRCKKGKDYARDEMTSPTRMVTSVLLVENSREPLTVKTERFIPKAKVFDCLAEIRKIKVSLPISIGDVMIKGVCGTDVDVVATRNLLEATGR